MDDPIEHTWNKLAFTRDLRHLWNVRSLARKLAPVTLGLRFVSGGAGEGKRTQPTQKPVKELRKEIWSLIEAAGLGNQFTPRDAASFLSEAERARAEFRPTTKIPAARALYNEPQLISRLDALASQTRAEMRKYPSSVEKTLAYFEAAAEDEASAEALVLLRDNVQLRKQATELLGFLGGPGSPPLGAEAFDNIARYRFLELYGPELGRDCLDEITDFFRRSVNEIELTTSWKDEAKVIHPGPYHVGETLWLMSRAPKLVCRLQPEIRRVLELLLEAQSAKGTWLDRDSHLERTRPPPQRQQDSASAAMCDRNAEAWR